MGDPLARSLWEVSWQDLSRSFKKIILTRSLHKISLTGSAQHHNESKADDTHKWQEGCESTPWIFTKSCAHHEKWPLKMWKAMFDTRFRALFPKGLRSTVPATHQKNDDSFTKRRFRPFQNIVLSSQNTARATKKSSKTTSDFGPGLPKF